MKFANRGALALAALLVSGLASAASVKTYQVTGPVTAMDDSSITVQKGKEEWQIAKDASTKMTGDVKVGTKVTIQYRMTAAEVEAKAEKAAKKSKKK